MHITIIIPNVIMTGLIGGIIGSICSIILVMIKSRRRQKEYSELLKLDKCYKTICTNTVWALRSPTKDDINFLNGYFWYNKITEEIWQFRESNWVQLQTALELFKAITHLEPNYYKGK
jgi:hypothetical protein